MKKKFACTHSCSEFSIGFGAHHKLFNIPEPGIAATPVDSLRAKHNVPNQVLQKLSVEANDVRNHPCPEGFTASF